LAVSDSNAASQMLSLPAAVPALVKALDSKEQAARFVAGSTLALTSRGALPSNTGMF
jgi:hypothetical protein